MESADQSPHVLAFLMELARSCLDAMSAFAPKLAGAALLILVGWVTATVVRRVTTNVASWKRLADLSERSGLAESLEKAGIRGGIGGIVGGIAYVVVLLLFVSAATDLMGWTVVSESLSALTGYAPNLLAAGLIAAVAVVVSRPAYVLASTFLRELDVPYHDGVAELARTGVLIAGGFVALRQLGIDTRFLDSNVYLIVAGCVIIVALPLALGARLVVGNLVSGLYVRRLYRAGQEVRLGDRALVVKSVNEVSVVFEQDGVDVYVPHSQLISKGYQA